MATFGVEARRRQAEFRTQSETISQQGRSPSDDKGRRNGHLLAHGYEKENLYPQLRGENGALKFFREREIKWHRTGRSGDTPGGNGPTRNMASSQIACVNFLLPLVSVEGALTAVIRAIDNDVQDVIEIVDGKGNQSPVDFEWIGVDKSLEGGTHRGQLETSVDSFVVAETDRGRRAYLMEWKYTESGGSGRYMGKGRKGEVRWPRYSPLYSTIFSSFGTENGAVPMNELLYEPFYQLLRNRLLGDQMVAGREHGVLDAKVVVVAPEENTAYRARITSPPLAERFPDLKTVDEVMRATLKNPDAAFKMVTPTELREAVESECGDAVSDWAEYIQERYGW